MMNHTYPEDRAHQRVGQTSTSGLPFDGNETRKEFPSSSKLRDRNPHPVQNQLSIERRVSPSGHLYPPPRPPPGVPAPLAPALLSVSAFTGRSASPLSASKCEVRPIPSSEHDTLLRPVARHVNSSPASAPTLVKVGIVASGIDPGDPRTLSGQLPISLDPQGRDHGFDRRQFQDQPPRNLIGNEAALRHSAQVNHQRALGGHPTTGLYSHSTLGRPRALDLSPGGSFLNQMHTTTSTPTKTPSAIHPARNETVIQTLNARASDPMLRYTNQETGRSLQSDVSLQEDPSQSEKAQKSFFKRPIRMKKDGKGPPPPLSMVTPFLLPHSSPHQLGVSAAHGGPPQMKPRDDHSNSTKQSNLAGPKSKPAMMKSKSNPLLAAAAKSILSGDSKIFQSFQANKGQSARPVQGDAYLASRGLYQPWASGEVPLAPISPRRVPVPAYNLDDIYAKGGGGTDKASHRLNRTTSHDRHRLVRPGTADSKHSRTSSLPYHQLVKLAPPLDAFAPSTDPLLSLQEIDINITVHDEHPVRFNLCDDLVTNAHDSGQEHVRVVGTESEDRAVQSLTSFALADPKKKRESTMSYEDFKDLVSKTLGISSNGGLDTVDNSIASLSLSFENSKGSHCGIIDKTEGHGRPHRANRQGGQFDQVSRLPSLSQDLPLPSDFDSSLELSFGSNLAHEGSQIFEPLNQPGEGENAAFKTESIALSPLERVMNPIGLIRSFSSSHSPSMSCQSKNNRHGNGKRPWSIGHFSSLHNAEHPIFNGTRQGNMEAKTPPITIPPPLPHFAMEGEVVQSHKLAEKTTGFPFPLRPSSEKLDLIPPPSQCLNAHPEGGGLAASLFPDGMILSRLPGPKSSNARPSSVLQATRKMSILLEDSEEDFKASLLSRSDGKAAGVSSTGAGGGDIVAINLMTDDNLEGTSVLEPSPEFPQTLFEEDMILADLEAGNVNRTDHRASRRPYTSPETWANQQKLYSSNPERSSNQTSPTENRGSSGKAFEKLMEKSLLYSSNFLPTPSSSGNRNQLSASRGSSNSKLIGPTTSLEAAAEILGHPIPSISKSIWKSFVDLQIQRQAGSEDALQSIAEYRDAGVQTEPQEANTPAYCDLVFNPSPLANSKDDVDPPNGKCETDNSVYGVDINPNDIDSLPLHVFDLEDLNGSLSSDSFVSLAEPDSVLESTPEIPAKIQEATEPNTSSFGAYMSLGARRSLKEQVRKNPEFLGHHKMRSISNLYAHHGSQSCHHAIVPSHQAIAQLRDAILVDRNTSVSSSELLSTNKSPMFAETVILALDVALKAEEAFQREKHHLQSVARRQSQTIESLLVDKETLTVEVARLTGLVELLARDHNELNERIDKAEAASTVVHASAKKRGLFPKRTSSELRNGEPLSETGWRRDSMKDQRCDPNVGSSTPIAERQRSDSAPTLHRKMGTPSTYPHVFGSDGDEENEEERLDSQEEDAVAVHQSHRRSLAAQRPMSKSPRSLPQLRRRPEMDVTEWSGMEAECSTYGSEDFQEFDPPYLTSLPMCSSPIPGSYPGHG